MYPYDYHIKVLNPFSGAVIRHYVTASRIGAKQAEKDAKSDWPGYAVTVEKIKYVPLY